MAYNPVYSISKRSVPNEENMLINNKKVQNKCSVESEKKNSLVESTLGFIKGMFSADNQNEINYKYSINDVNKFKKFLSEINHEITLMILNLTQSNQTDSKTSITNNIDLVATKDINLNILNNQKSKAIDLNKIDSKLSLSITAYTVSNILDALKAQFTNESNSKVTQFSNANNEAGFISQLASILPFRGNTQQTISQSMKENKDICNIVENYFTKISDNVKVIKISNNFLNSITTKITTSIYNNIQGKAENISLILINDQSIKLLKKSVIESNLVLEIFQNISNVSIFKNDASIENSFKSHVVESSKNINKDEKISSIAYAIGFGLTALAGIGGVFYFSNNNENTIKTKFYSLPLKSLFKDIDFITPKEFNSLNDNDKKELIEKRKEEFFQTKKFNYPDTIVYKDLNGLISDNIIIKNNLKLPQNWFNYFNQKNPIINMGRNNDEFYHEDSDDDILESAKGNFGKKVKNKDMFM